MKKSSLIILSALSLLGTVTPLVDPLATLPEVPVYDWNYAAYEFGFGAGYLHAQWPATPSKIVNPVLPNDIAAQKNEASSTRSSETNVPLPDIRLGLEKSWHFAKHWTATLDFALMTPAVTCGYLISPRTRLFIGAHYSLLLNLGYTKQSLIQSSSSTSEDGTTITHSSETINQIVRTKNPFLGLAPRVGIDHFLSPSTMLRVSASCDAQKLYDAANRTNTGSLLWPQLSVGVKKFF